MELTKYRGRYCVYWRDERSQPIRRSLGTDDPAEAQRRFIEFKRTLELRRRSAGYTVAELWSLRKASLGGRRLQENMFWTEKSLMPHFGSLRASDVQESVVKEYSQKRSHLKPGTLYTELNHLRMTLNWAKKTGLIQDTPWFALPGRSAPKADYLTKDQFRAVLAECAFPHLRLFCTLAVATGARRSALLELKWSQVDLSRRQINLTQDSASYQKGRAIVPVNNTLFAALEEAQTVAQTDFVIEYLQERVLSVSKGVKAAGQRAGLPYVSPHVFRHSAAVWMVEAGISMEEVAQYLGHTNPGITRRVYARFSPTHLRQAAAALEF